MLCKSPIGYPMLSKKPLVGIPLDYELPSSEGDKLRGYTTSPWYALREQYILSLQEAGALPLCIPFCEDSIDQYLDCLDGLLLPGGRDIHPSLYGEANCHPSVFVTPKRSEFELALAKKALDQDMPILGVCAGHQIINVALGGTLFQHIPDMVLNALTHQDPQNPTAVRHSITIDKNTRLYSIIEDKTAEWTVNSNHHQSIKDLGKDLILSAVTPDGVIEAIESSKHRFVLGIQWHPEYHVCPIDKLIFKAFVEACCL